MNCRKEVNGVTHQPRGLPCANIFLGLKGRCHKLGHDGPRPREVAPNWIIE